LLFHSNIVYAKVPPCFIIWTFLSCNCLSFKIHFILVIRKGIYFRSPSLYTVSL